MLCSELLRSASYRQSARDTRKPPKSTGQSRQVPGNKMQSGAKSRK